MRRGGEGRKEKKKKGDVEREQKKEEDVRRQNVGSACDGSQEIVNSSRICNFITFGEIITTFFCFYSD